MNEIENRIKQGLRNRGIPCHTVYKIPSTDENQLLISFASTAGGDRLTPSKVEKALNELGIGVFRAAYEFHRLSAAFLHLEVFGSIKTEQTPTDGAS